MRTLFLLFMAATAHAGGSGIYDRRMADWRCRQVVYQVLVDRFARGSEPTTRRERYPAAGKIRDWSEMPSKGQYLEAERVWSHEIDFWGGDLPGLTGKIDHLVKIGANVLYLNPIFRAFTNHKYDTIDYFEIDPAFGTRADFEALCREAHARKIRVVLDGVFNHVGHRSTWFQSAQDPASPHRSFFRFGSQYPAGYVAWIDVANLPELDFDQPMVRRAIYDSPESVVQSWLALADGWRLDVAFELGPRLLGELTAAAHRARPDAYTVGEIYNYPSGWIPALDGVMNMYLAQILTDVTHGKTAGPLGSEQVEALVADTDYEGLLRSWIVLANHDRPRLATLFPDAAQRAFALALQVTLPGAPLVYYGDEVGMTGGWDPEQRGPMDWKAVEAGSAPDLALVTKLLALRNASRALMVGDFRRIASRALFAFERYTDTVEDAVVVLANPTDAVVEERVSPRDPWLMDDTEMQDAMTGEKVKVGAGTLLAKVPARTVQILRPVLVASPGGYERYKRAP